jgi:hypothetical protein
MSRAKNCNDSNAQKQNKAWHGSDTLAANELHENPKLRIEMLMNLVKIQNCA